MKVALWIIEDLGLIKGLELDVGALLSFLIGIRGLHNNQEPPATHSLADTRSQHRGCSPRPPCIASCMRAEGGNQWDGTLCAVVQGWVMMLVGWLWLILYVLDEP